MIRITTVYSNFLHLVYGLVSDKSLLAVFVFCLFFRIGPIQTGSMAPILNVGDVVLTLRTWPIYYGYLLTTQRVKKATMARFYATRAVIASYESDYFTPGTPVNIFHRVSVITPSEDLVISGYTSDFQIKTFQKAANLRNPVYISQVPGLERLIRRLSRYREVDIVHPFALSTIYLCTLSTNKTIGQFALLCCKWRSTIVKLVSVMMIVLLFLALGEQDDREDSMR